MFTFTAPHNGPEDVTILPDPEWEDTKAQQSMMNLRKSMNNLTYTYIKKKTQRYKFNYVFILTRLKSLEFIAFVETYYEKMIRWTDHKGKTWYGFIVNDPIVFESIQINEITKIPIELEGNEM